MGVQTLISAEEFAIVSGEWGPCELVRGEVVRMSPAGEMHALVVSIVSHKLRLWTETSRTGRVYAGEAGVQTSGPPDTVRGADVAYVSYQRKPKGRAKRGFLRLPPELIVEVLGAGRTWTQLLEKSAEYLKMGVDRVWLIDPDRQTLHVLRSDAPPVELAGDAEVRDEAILPKFSGVLSDFFVD